MDATTMGKYQGRKFKFEATWIVRRNTEYPIAIVGSAYTPGFPKTFFVSFMSAEFALLMGFDPQCIMNCVQSGCASTSKCDVNIEQVNMDEYRKLVVSAVDATKYEVGQVPQVGQSMTQSQQTPQITEVTEEKPRPISTSQQATPSTQQSQQPQQQQTPVVEVIPGVFIESDIAKHFNIDVIRYELGRIAVQNPARYGVIKSLLPRYMFMYAKIADEKYKNYSEVLRIYMATQALLQKLLSI
jgi:hypothetical protein